MSDATRSPVGVVAGLVVVLAGTGLAAFSLDGGGVVIVPSTAYPFGTVGGVVVGYAAARGFPQRVVGGFLGGAVGVVGPLAGFAWAAEATSLSDTLTAIWPAAGPVPALIGVGLAELVVRAVGRVR
ncbi:MAG: hypothetical protein ABEI75_05395 [Halobaculum sp.]